MATTLLFQSIPEALILQVEELDTSKSMGGNQGKLHGCRTGQGGRLQTLMTESDRHKMKDTETIDNFVGKLSEISSNSAALGVNIEESKLVKKFFKSLPQKKFIHIVASFEQVLDLKTTSFTDILRCLKAYEERIFDEEEETQEDQSKLMYTDIEPSLSKEDQNKLMYSNMETSSKMSGNREYNDDYRGSGRGIRFYSRGRGRGRFNETRYLSRITCYRCDKTSHYASNCPDRLLKLQEAQEDNKDTQNADELLMHEVVYLNEKNCIYETNSGEENIWYLDNEASNHMTGDRRYFTKIDHYITGKVRFGDDS